jgi:hypothetical protein
MEQFSLGRQFEEQDDAHSRIFEEQTDSRIHCSHCNEDITQQEKVLVAHGLNNSLLVFCGSICAQSHEKSIKTEAKSIAELQQLITS